MSTSHRELLWDRWIRHATEHPDAEAIVHWKAGEPPVRWTWGRLVASAAGVAEWLTAAGVRPGDVCAIVQRHHPAFHPLYLGVCAAGAIPSVLAYPNARLHPEKFASGLSGMARHSGLDFVLTEKALAPVISPLVGGPGSSIRGLLFPVEDGWAPADPAGLRPARAADDPCLLQHSSGTTGLQKAVVLSHRAVLDHVARYAEAVRLDAAADRIVSWLPLYHDMGLIATYQMALAEGVPTVQLDPFEWVTAPSLLLEAISAERGTLTWLPNFAFAFLADRVRDGDLEGVSLGTMRLWVNCSEPVRADSHARFLRRFAPRGVRPETLAACYAMAETTFAATQTAPGRPAKTLAVDRGALAEGAVEPARAERAARICVSSGAPIGGCTLRVVDADRRPLPSGRVGELAIASESLFDGYRNRPEDTARVLSGRWYYSGDLGFEHEGEYYVIGRKKDLIIVAGNNLYPEDIEDEVGRVPGVLPGRVVAFGVEDAARGTEQVQVVAETELAGGPERRRLEDEIVRAAMRLDVTVARVHLVPPRWLIKSSSGKPSRSANRERIVSGALEQPERGVA
ncbi:AMP-binding protein [Anaeromyxobacter sp. PSR-1]|uniref:AMP-binding protein n=1 Tax=Anaeromyxobacter sp. PSR-1 TaxID=1300915 RepID=UPI001364AD39|nr:AMP-binding protein [Anaeromyxobacter sp. PSR-1]